MSSSNSCFLTCTQISQEGGKMVSYSYLFKNFPQFIVTHTVKGFSQWSRSRCFSGILLPFYDPTDVGNLVPLPFLNPSCTSGSSLYIYCWSRVWRYGKKQNLFICDLYPFLFEQGYVRRGRDIPAKEASLSYKAVKKKKVTTYSSKQKWSIFCIQMNCWRSCCCC